MSDEGETPPATPADAEPTPTSNADATPVVDYEDVAGENNSNRMPESDVKDEEQASPELISIEQTSKSEVIVDALVLTNKGAEDPFLMKLASFTTLSDTGATGNEYRIDVVYRGINSVVRFTALPIAPGLQRIEEFKSVILSVNNKSVDDDLRSALMTLNTIANYKNSEFGVLVIEETPGEFVLRTDRLAQEVNVDFPHHILTANVVLKACVMICERYFAEADTDVELEGDKMVVQDESFPVSKLLPATTRSRKRSSGKGREKKSAENRESLLKLTTSAIGNYRRSVTEQAREVSSMAKNAAFSTLNKWKRAPASATANNSQHVSSMADIDLDVNPQPEETIEESGGGMHFPRPSLAKIRESTRSILTKGKQAINSRYGTTRAPNTTQESDEQRAPEEAEQTVMDREADNDHGIPQY